MPEVGPFRYQLEMHPCAAVFYLGGDRCSPHDVACIGGFADTLPQAVVRLCIDTTSLSDLNSETAMELQRVISRWTAARRGTARQVGRLRSGRTPASALPPIVPRFMEMVAR
jgi:hypothetical protein